MSNKTLAFLIITVLIAMGLLIALNMLGTFNISSTEKYVSRNHVRGMAVEHKGNLYTLNFEQQNTIIDILNRSIKIGPEGYLMGDIVKFDYTALIIYLFDKPEIKIIPVTFENNQLIFQAPGINPNGLLRETGPGELHPLLLKTYDTP
jgi:hypothetical protein